jgi:tetratricopeptide (TPR) repeat protein
LIVATARRTNRALPRSAEPLIPLARLGDALLRALARAHLADNFADSLRKRSLRDDLALWAVGAASVEQLLEMQYTQLQAEARRHPANIELHYRTGLIARSLGKMEEAEQAFGRVLRLHPHHLGAASRMAATSLELEHIEKVLPVLGVAFAVPVELIARYRLLARVAGEPSHFDQTVELLVQQLGNSADPAAVRANLALALAELGMLDARHETWRDPLHTAAAA